MTKAQHDSDCAVHNEPAYPNGPCSCGFEIERLRAALQEIADMHKGDQPAAMNTSDLAWADRHILTMRIAARDALKQSE